MDLFEARSALNRGRSIYDLALRVTFYARVSTEKEAQLHSLAAQSQYFTQFISSCTAWRFVDGYVDEGLSGTNAGKREQFLQMIEDARQGKFDFIITKEISRFSRNTLDSIHYTQELLKCGVGVLFQADNINTLMPDAELRLTIMSSIAQDEVRKISERVRFGFKRAIEAGVVLGNSKIWGYEKQDGKLVIQEQEAEMVRLIFDLYANRRMGIRAISTYLVQQGYQNTRGAPLSFSTIRGILSNPKYKGYYCGGKSCKYDYKLSQRRYIPQAEWVMYRDIRAVPPIVSEQLWDRANEILQSRAPHRELPGRAVGQNRYTYSGKIFCGEHQTPYYRAIYHYGSGNKEVWQCQEYSRKGKKGCGMPVLYTAEIDELLRLSLEQLPFDREEMLHSMLHIYGDVQVNSREQQYIAKCRKSMEEVQRRKDKLLELNIAGYLTNEEFSQRNQRFNQQLAELDARLKTLEAAAEKKKDSFVSEERLRPALERELTFSRGFERGVVEALVERLEVCQTQTAELIQVNLSLRPIQKQSAYLIRRRRGAPSVCTAQYI